MNAEEYQADARRLTEEELAREIARLADERERAEAAERARQAAEEAERLAQEAQRRAAMPLGLRLIEERCTRCHSPDFLANQRRGWLGWWAVVLRMELLNGAEFAAGERRVIVDYLAEHQNASSVRNALEWLVAVGAVVLAPLVWLGWQRASRSRMGAT